MARRGGKPGKKRRPQKKIKVPKGYKASLISQLKNPLFYRTLTAYLFIFTLLLLIMNPQVLSRMNKSRYDITAENYCFKLDLAESNKCGSFYSCNNNCQQACADIGKKHSSADFTGSRCVCYCE